MTKHEKHVAIYVRVSSKAQDTRSQEPDLQRWADAQELPVRWYQDKASGRSMDRPGWKSLEAAMRAGTVATIVCWRLDRLGRTASGLTALFDELQSRRVNLVSLKEGIDLATAAGRMLAGVLASLSQFENEVRGDRIRAGQAAAKSRGVRWGGSRPGLRKKVTSTQEHAIHSLKRDGKPITHIALAVGLDRSTVYRVLRECPEKDATRKPS